MTSYTHFIGIDIGKFTFVVNIYGQTSTCEYDNTPAGFHAFMKEHRKILKRGLSILETTGGYEMGLLLTLCDQGYRVHRADTRKVKNFIRSYGRQAKTDALDAKALALYGVERSARLNLFVPASRQALALYELVQRRKDLTSMMVAEKNRYQSPRSETIKANIQSMIQTLKAHIDALTLQINQLIAQDDQLAQKQKVLMSIPGIGEITANSILVLLPELGELDRRQIASLCGLAPQAQESGQYKGYRRTGHGRAGLKPILFMSAMAARTSKSSLKEFYEKLILKGKKKMVALTALMRKIIIMANARIRDHNKEYARKEYTNSLLNSPLERQA